MKPITILLFGKNGQVGWELQRSLAPLGDLIALDFDSQEFCGDFTNLGGLAKTISDVAPDVIVNAAAIDVQIAHAPVFLTLGLQQIELSEQNLDRRLCRHRPEWTSYSPGNPGFSR